MTIRGVMLVLIPLAVLAGCQAEVVQPTEARAPSDAASIKLYSEEPKRYEDLGFVEVPEDIMHRQSNRVDDVVERLKARAAEKGANGVLLVGPGGKGMYRVGAYYGEDYYIFPYRDRPTKAVLGKAIYVLKE